MTYRTRRPATTAALCTAALVLAAAHHASAGPLTPPAGPVASTGKTLQQVEPRTDVNTLSAAPGFARHVITQPGSYYLSANVSPSAGEVGIYITASNVTIDLNGFAILGGGVSDDGIYANFVTNITVRNGTIANTVKEGLDLFGTDNVRLENLTIRGATNGFGVIAGNAAVVKDCLVTNSGAGFILGTNAVVQSCTAQNNTGVGFQLNNGSAATNCTARGNSASGFFIGSFTTLTACASTSNAGSGVEVFQDAFSEGVRVERCTIADNQLDGVRQPLAVDCTYVDNTITRNRRAGLRVDDGNLIARNHIANNGATPNAEGGVLLPSGSVQNVLDSNTFIANAPASVVIASGASNNLVIRNTFTAGPAITNSGTNSTIGATVAGPNPALSTTNPLANIQY